MQIIKREKTKKILVKDVVIGNSNHVVIQSMTNTKTKNINETLKQIQDLKNVGCELVRVCVFDYDDAYALKEIVDKSVLPIIADIHFNYEFALIAIKSGCPKIRLNPGNISDISKINLIIDLAKKYNTAIRIGVNSGSLDQKYIKKYGISPKAMIKNLESYIKIFERKRFYNLVLSLKSSDQNIAYKAYLLASKKWKYPLHLGITEAGYYEQAIIKSAIGLADLLKKGIGNTIRISITGNPINEIKICKILLKQTNVDKNQVEIISCPTCGRMDYNLDYLVNKTLELTKNINKNIKISILGCAVNGIGEGKNSDIGIAGTKNGGILFFKGKIVGTFNEEELFIKLIEYLNLL